MIIEQRLPQSPDALPPSWAWADFDSVVEVVSDGQRRVKQRDYLKTGRVPIVDQGDGMFAGFSDDEGFAVPHQLPLLVFGDHTRRIKLLSQRFAVGADGVKLLRPRGPHDPRYVAWALGSLPIVNRGYSRHFSFLRAIRVPLPPAPEQTRIAERIDELFTDLSAGWRRWCG
jgi:type I restriction enzyme S subunit